ncbi:hypothetical protein CSA56_10495 [candidate division KSB3 bacterium]|uniref:Uncharacterized protein n=1 Tax=candidate division KSB3 bacterium TaxID=2044937 RepID=A0A2G6KDH6_9BACT|nr:MAG: hypothetical protein CSA56_10495 [candidate division KSB3 bacterium]
MKNSVLMSSIMIIMALGISSVYADRQLKIGVIHIRASHPDLVVLRKSFLSGFYDWKRTGRMCAEKEAVESAAMMTGHVSQPSLQNDVVDGDKDLDGRLGIGHNVFCMGTCRECFLLTRVEVFVSSVLSDK